MDGAAAFFGKEAEGMRKDEYRKIEGYMLSCMQDSAHDKDHVYRVLYNALVIAGSLPEVDMDVLVTACLLHDVGRPEQIADPSVCHAQVGSEKAYAFLREIGWTEERAEHVRRCILSHRFRKSAPPESIEAKILYDADKLDVTGAVGVARTLMYNGALNEPMYTTGADGRLSEGAEDEPDSFLREYRFKLEKVYDRFLTAPGRELAQQRRKAAKTFVDALLNEMKGPERAGLAALDELLE